MNSSYYILLVYIVSTSQAGDTLSDPVDDTVY